MQKWTKSHNDHNKYGDDDEWPKKVSYLRLIISALMRNSNIFSIFFWVLPFCLICALLNIYELKKLQYELLSHASRINEVIPQQTIHQQTHCSKRKPVVIISGNHPTSGYLDHVFKVFQRLGYKTIINQTEEWDVLWSHGYPFVDEDIDVSVLKPHQMVNHFPGSGYITSKVTLASVKSNYIPKAFKIPEQKEDFLSYVKENPDKLWVQKSNSHRGIQIQHFKDLNLNQQGTFVQEFIHNPFLIDGRKFDIGIYTIITSLDPLRVYIYDGDVLLRFCPQDYLPFDAHLVDKYVVGDDYTPTWEMPSLKRLYEENGFTHKETLNHYIRSLGKNPDLVWKQVKEAIRNIIYAQVKRLIESVVYYNYKLNRHFFEMMRFDLILDEKLQVFIMEANMSPNLSSEHFPPNKLIYEQVLFNLFNVVGLASAIHRESLADRNVDISNMQVSDKDILVDSEMCMSERCDHGCNLPECQVCEVCLTTEEKRILRAAYSEHMNRKNCRRIIPEALDPTAKDFKKVNDGYAKLSNKNRLMAIWFQGKCNQDLTWCI